MVEWKKSDITTDGSEFAVSDVVEIFFRRRIVVLVVTVFVLLVSIYFATRPRKFSAQGVLRIEPGSAGRYSTSPASALGGGGDKIASETEILQSRTVYLQVAKELDLANQPAFWGVTRLAHRSIEDPKWRDLTIARMQARISVSHSPKDEIVRISAVSTSRDLSATIVNTLIEDYIEDLFKMKLGANNRVSKWLIGQLDDLKQQIQNDQKVLVELQNKLGVLGLDNKNANYLPAETLDQFTKAASDATIGRIVAEARFRFLNESNPGLIESEQPLLGSSSSQSLLQNLRASQATAAAEYAQLSAQFGPNYPDVKRARATLQSDNAQVKAEQERIINQAKLAYNAAKANEDMTLGAVAKRRTEASKNQDDIVKYTILLHDYEGHRALYEGLVQRLREAGITSGLESGEIDIVDLADAPYFPMSPAPIIIVIGGLLLGGVLGCLGALITELFDTKVSTWEQAEKITHLPLLGLLPKLTQLELQDSVLQHLPEVASAPRSHYAEALQSLHSSILLMQRGAHGKVFLLTSALPGEGKSTTSRNLAHTFSQHDSRTLLIDCDLRRGKVNQAFRISNAVGLVDVLSNRASFDQAIVPIVGAENLFVLPTGNYPLQAAVLLASQAMQQLVAECRKKFDFIILDCPPLIGLSDAIALSSLSDGIILVVREEFTNKRALSDAIRVLSSVDDKPVGFTMNSVSNNQLGYYNSAYYDDSRTKVKA